MPEETLTQLLREVHAATVGLSELLNRDYPTRREAELRLNRTEGVISRRMTTLAIGMLISIPISMFVTFGTLSTCFLKSGYEPGPAACNVIPGYRDSQERNKIIFQQFAELQKETNTNRKRMNRLEERLR